MFLPQVIIEKNSFVNDIVKQNHRTADVFKKNGIEYCCGAKWPLEVICNMQGLSFDLLKQDLEYVCRITDLPPALDYHSWDIDFMTSYLVNVHHHYLKKNLARTAEIIQQFADSHRAKFPWVQEVENLLATFIKKVMPHIQYEEDTVFPYICQVAHAHKGQDSYAKLLVKTLRKPIAELMDQETDILARPMFALRLLTTKYTIPPNACTSHRLAFLRLKELDNDLMQHLYLENEILFPRILQIEKDLLK